MKNALVTGTSSGFGMLTAVRLAREGFRVIAVMRDVSRSERLRQAAAEAGVTEQIELKELDVSQLDRVQAEIPAWIESYGRIDVLVNNAGYAVGGFVEEIPMESWKEQFETNVFGLIAVTKAVIPFMRKQGSGTIINVSSISGAIGFPALAPYTSSKFAVEGFSESLRLELLPFGVFVVLIQPGPFKTDIWRKGLDGLAANEASSYEAMLRRISRSIDRTVERAGDPKEVVDAIVHAAQSAKPKLRYAMGSTARFQLLLKRMLPWSLIERTARKQM